MSINTKLENMASMDKNADSRQVVVSMTSYPARIHGVAQVLGSIFNQTVQPDKIVVYLSKEQFPGENDSLPHDLVHLALDNHIEIRYVQDDLGPHKKYYYAFSEFPDALIITVDDDLIYKPTMIEELLASHEKFPHAVIASRVHYMLFDENGQLLPYAQWLMEFDGLINKPSFRLFATGVAGVLYPAALFKDFEFTSELLDLAKNADDLLLKAAEVALGIPVVLAAQQELLNYIPNTQEVGLFHANLDQGENDIQWKALNDWFKNQKNLNLEAAIYSLGNEDSGRDVEKVAEFLAQQNRELQNDMNAIYSSRSWRAAQILARVISKIKKPFSR